MEHVEIPNYVFDIWMPLLGGSAINIYCVYCRLEQGGKVKGIPQNNIARACRMGKATLRNINDTLQECGFIKVIPPKGRRRLEHKTVTIEVFKAPATIPTELMQKYQPNWMRPVGMEANNDKQTR